MIYIHYINIANLKVFQHAMSSFSRFVFKNSSWNNEIFVEYQKTFRYILWEYASYILMGFFDVRPYFALVLKPSAIIPHLNFVYISLKERSVLKSVHNVHCQNTRNTFSRFFLGSKYIHNNISIVFTFLRAFA